MIRVLIVDDHHILRQGLKQILAETKDMAVVGEAENGLRTIKLVQEIEVDVLLLDISMPDKNGIEVLKQLRKEHPKLAVLILSMYREDQYAVQALKAGASGYLTKHSAPELLVTAIRHVASGRKYVSPSVAERLADILGGDTEKLPHETLSYREHQTLCLIASGKTLTGCAAEMSLSVKTVSVYRSRLLEKMKLKNNAELTHYAIKHQFVE